jgi:two-component system phosphate regulon sensor histidine kinase PhoR
MKHCNPKRKKLTDEKIEKGATIILNDMSSDYKSHSNEKDFVANVLHEIKTPITILQGYAETLADMPNISPELLKEISNKIFSSSKRLGNTVKNLSLLSEADNLSYKRFIWCNIVSILENCKEALLLVNNGVKVVIKKPKEDVFVLANAGLIELSFTNILENAVRYSSSAAEIYISIYEKENQVFIEIEDRGIGIDSSDLENIFNRFYMVNKSYSKKFGGSGLGLSLVKRIVEKHRGTISVTSKIGFGSCFIVKFPMYK